MKAFASETRRKVGLVAAELQGASALEAASEDAPGREEKATWIEEYFLAFGATISAGSSEIQRNIIAERVLGLPRS
jgi:alkylation response protein AidB-like acyl-CoA dehydrogenase